VKISLANLVPIETHTYGISTYKYDSQPMAYRLWHTVYMIYLPLYYTFCSPWNIEHRKKRRVERVLLLYGKYVTFRILSGAKDFSSPSFGYIAISGKEFRFA
jgi:hypothetical protein